MALLSSAVWLGAEARAIKKPKRGLRIREAMKVIAPLLPLLEAILAAMRLKNSHKKKRISPFICIKGLVFVFIFPTIDKGIVSAFFFSDIQKFLWLCRGVVNFLFNQLA